LRLQVQTEHESGLLSPVYQRPTWRRLTTGRAPGIHQLAEQPMHQIMVLLDRQGVQFGGIFGQVVQLDVLLADVVLQLPALGHERAQFRPGVVVRSFAPVGDQGALPRRVVTFATAPGQQRETLVGKIWDDAGGSKDGGCDVNRLHDAGLRGCRRRSARASAAAGAPE